MSAYEERLCAKGATVFGLCAKPGPEPAHVVQTAPLSLVDYLPDDLSTMGYVPHGMERTVTNLRNLEAKGRPRTDARHADRRGRTASADGGAGAGGASRRHQE